LELGGGGGSSISSSCRQSSGKPDDIVEFYGASVRWIGSTQVLQLFVEHNNIVQWSGALKEVNQHGAS